jgi:hypothetical protein
VSVLLEPLVDGLVVPLLEVLPLVEPPVAPPVELPGVVVVAVELLVSLDFDDAVSSRRWHAVNDASAMRVMAPACAIFSVFITIPCRKVAEGKEWFTAASARNTAARVADPKRAGRVPARLAQRQQTRPVQPFVSANATRATGTSVAARGCCRARSPRAREQQPCP